MKWIFVYICATFACQYGVVAVEGDGRYYLMKISCEAAAKRDIATMPKDFRRSRQAVCVQREELK